MINMAPDRLWTGRSQPVQYAATRASPETQVQPILNIAIRAARSAGALIVRQLERADSLDVTTKGRNDFVTEVDQRSEQIIIDTIRKAYPDHGILAEESGRRGGGEYLWIIDPLDGTTNFLHNFPHFAVSIAFQHRSQIVQAVIFDPIRQELFTASRGEGAQLDNRRIRVSRKSDLDTALLGTGFPFRELSNLKAYLSTLEAFLPKCAGIRRAGSAALDLAYVAAGRLDGFWEFGLKPWDIAAGALLIHEAGGFVSDPVGGESYLDCGDIVAGSPKIAKKMLQILHPLVADKKL
jgi:myo-inositol-1(or 4)-monophosphatase